MKTITKGCVLLAVIISLALHANAQELTLTSKSYDFGKIANLDFPPAVFEFENTGNQPLAILMIQKNPDVKVHFERKYIQPGEKGMIQATYNSNTLGKFEEELKIISNASDKPQLITLTGEFISVLDCFPNKSNMNVRIIKVIDKLTKKPVPDAALEMVHNKRTPVNFKVDDEGKKEQELKIGLYDIHILAPGYEKLENSLFLEKSVPYLYFELDPIKNNPTPEPVTEVESNPQTETAAIEDNPAELSRDKFAENNVVLLVDVSLSMKNSNKLNLLKSSMFTLVEALRDIDRVTVISYSSLPKVHLESVSGNEKENINQVIDGLYPQGITNGVKGLEKAYELALTNKMARGNNQIILATDGKFSGSDISDETYNQLVKEHADRGIIMTIVGYGSDEEAIARLQKMAILGNGSYYQVNKKEDASHLLLEEIKKNSKIQKH